ncbi:MAG: ankyrin repeat domain-containing protein [Gammaproteobacteria bacterium]
MKTQLKMMLTAAIIAIGRGYAMIVPCDNPPHPAKQNKRKTTMLNFLRALCVIFLAAIIGGAAFADDGKTDLHWAALLGKVAEVNRLINGGADVNTKDNGGKTPLHGAAREGITETALALIKVGADVNAKDNGGETPLHGAAERGTTEIALALIKAGADVNAKDNDGNTPLYKNSFWFKIWGDKHERAYALTETALALIKSGADVNANKYGNTPFHGAASAGQTEVVLALIKAKADVNAKNNEGWTPLHSTLVELVRRNDKPERAYALTETALALIEAEANVNAKIDDYTPLHIATEVCGIGIARALVEAGADTNAKTKKGWTALHNVAKGCNTPGGLDLALAFVKAGADIDGQNEFGETPLDLAIAEHGKDSRMAQFLLKNESAWQKAKRWFDD